MGATDGAEAACALCGEGFRPRSRTQRFCTPACRIRARFRPEQGDDARSGPSVHYVCAGCGTLHASRARARTCPVCAELVQAVVRVVPGPDACVACLHWVAHPGADYGYACEKGRFLLCRPHRPGARPYAPRGK